MRPSLVRAWLYLERWGPGGHRDLDHCRLPGRERFLQGRIEMFWISTPALGAKDARHFSKAGIVQGGTNLAPLKTRALIVLRRSQGVVHEHDYHDANAVMHGRGEFGQRVHKAAITGDGHHWTLGQRHFRAQSHGKAKTQGRKVGRREIGAWLPGAVGKMCPVPHVGDATH